MSVEGQESVSIPAAAAGAVTTSYQAMLTWDALCVTGQSAKEMKQILKNVSGYVEPGAARDRPPRLGPNQRTSQPYLSRDEME